LNGSFGGPGAIAPLPQVATLQAAAQIVSQLDAATEFCSVISRAAYVVDCLSERLAVIAEAMPDTGEYAEARDALALASRDLLLSVKENPSATLPEGVARSTGSYAQVNDAPAPCRQHGIAWTDAACRSQYH